MVAHWHWFMLTSESWQPNNSSNALGAWQNSTWGVSTSESSKFGDGYDDKYATRSAKWQTWWSIWGKTGGLGPEKGMALIKCDSKELINWKTAWHPTSPLLQWFPWTIMKKGWMMDYTSLFKAQRRKVLPPLRLSSSSCLTKPNQYLRKGNRMLNAIMHKSRKHVPNKSPYKIMVSLSFFLSFSSFFLCTTKTDSLDKAMYSSSILRGIPSSNFDKITK